MKKICVIGSINMDLVTTVKNFPKSGETVLGNDFNLYCGGKGGNQAVAAGKLGATVAMFGKIGNDMYGKEYIENLKNSNVEYKYIQNEENVSTGTAIIEVEESSENKIIIIPGANNEVDKEYIDNNMKTLLEYDIFLFQLEIPMSTVVYAAKKLKEHDKVVIVDPAPAVKLPKELLECTDYLTPNETELEIVTGTKINSQDDLRQAVSILLDSGVGKVIHKAGKNGAYIIDENDIIHVEGYKVDAIDTTAAGDSFNAGFAFALSKGYDLDKCVEIANAVGGLATTGMGAQSAMPIYENVLTLINK
ncbi:ribokinase [Vallitalea longa]|uniref:Ribokinase n=1 Tax=Vallitalea longa TaxID=2936439 RepID=A0A9W5Y902_9FIRM|nr:ribokinase [Vallitalea longa]GKX28220.1 ribokinase [Vallitalea longa]